jgi:hypothetical protein
MAFSRQEVKGEVPCNVRLCSYGRAKKCTQETGIICKGCSLNDKSSFDRLMLRLFMYLHKRGKYNLQSLLTLLTTTIITTSPRQAQEEANECTDRWGRQRGVCSCRLARI